MSLQKSLSQLSADTDKHVNNFVKNETNVNVLRVALIGYSVLINKIPNEVISLFDKFGIRLLVTALIAYLLFKDVITSLLLSLCFILSIQELKKRQNVKPTTNSGYINSEYIPSHSPRMYSPIQEEQPMFLDEVINNPEDSHDPAFKTLTENLVEGSFTSDQQFQDAQSNFVQGVDPDTGVKTFVNQHGSQGLDVPMGNDPSASRSSAF